MFQQTVCCCVCEVCVVCVRAAVLLVRVCRDVPCVCALCVMLGLSLLVDSEQTTF
jgi:hypothetical protein